MAAPMLLNCTQIFTPFTNFGQYINYSKYIPVLGQIAQNLQVKIYHIWSFLRINKENEKILDMALEILESLLRYHKPPQNRK